MRSWRNRTACRAPGSDHQQALVERGRQPLLHHARRLAGGGLQQAQLGPPAQTRHRLHQLPRRRRHGRDPRRQQPGHLGPAQVRAHGRGVPPPPGGGRRQHARRGAAR